MEKLILGAINIDDIKVAEPIFRNIRVASFKEGIFAILILFCIVLIVAAINVIFARMMKIRKKDLLSIFLTNIIVKTSIYSPVLLLDDYFRMFFFSFLLFPVAAIIEGLIYRKILTYKKYGGIKVAIICNLGVVLSFILLYVVTLMIMWRIMWRII